MASNNSSVDEYLLYFLYYDFFLNSTVGRISILHIIFCFPKGSPRTYNGGEIIK